MLAICVRIVTDIIPLWVWNAADIFNVGPDVTKMAKMGFLPPINFRAHLRYQKRTHIIDGEGTPYGGKVSRKMYERRKGKGRIIRQT